MSPCVWVCVHSFVIGSSLASVVCCAIKLRRRAFVKCYTACYKSWEGGTVCGMTVFVCVIKLNLC